jgi:hypothetical protein
MGDGFITTASWRRIVSKCHVRTLSRAQQGDGFITTASWRRIVSKCHVRTLSRAQQVQALLMVVWSHFQA